MIALQLEFHTRDSALRTLCRKYWAVTEEGKFAHGIRELAREFGVPAGKLSRKVGQNCTAFSNELACSDCLRTHDPRSRSEYEERLRAREWTCLDCVEKARLAREEARRIEEERKRQVLADHYRSHTLEALSLERLTFTSAVYLLSFVRAGASEDLSY